uniref:p38 n=1 Tax=Peanut clump virus B TaxID=188884 RepID=Q8B0X7_9VIRU|nr:P38 [Peanut clump virus B]
MGTFQVDDPSLFISPGREHSSSLGYVRVFRCLDYNSKSGIVFSDFDLVCDIDVLLLNSVFDKYGNQLVKAPVTHDSLFITPCSCTISGLELRRLHDRLVKHHEIVNNAGQVMLRLAEDHEVFDIVNGVSVMVSAYVRCADVFLWSDFGAPADATLCKLFARYRLFSDDFVDDVQGELDVCRSKSSPNPVGNSQRELDTCRAELAKVKKDLSDARNNEDSLKKRLKAEEVKVKDLTEKLSECERKGGVSAVEACETRWRGIVADMRRSHDEDTARHFKTITTLTDTVVQITADFRRKNQLVKQYLWDKTKNSPSSSFQSQAYGDAFRFVRDNLDSDPIIT